MTALVLSFSVNGSDNWELYGTPFAPPDGRVFTQVDISGDGERIAVGSCASFKNCVMEVRVYDLSQDTWSQVGRTLRVNQGYGDISLSKDGTTISFSGSSKSSADRVYSYRWDNLTQDWAKLGQEISGGRVGFYGVNLNSDGNVLGVSVYGSSRIRFYDYELSTDRWVLRPEFFEYALSQLSISGDGNRVVTGNRRYGGTFKQAEVKIFDWTSTGWKKVGQSIYNTSPADDAGFVDISEDGRILAVGAPGNDGNGTNSGEVRVFEFSLEDNWWREIGRFNGNPGEFLRIRGVNNALSRDGKRVLATGGGNDSPDTRYAGFAEIREYNSETKDWDVLGDRLTGILGQEFCCSFAMDAGGTTVVSSSIAVSGLSPEGYRGLVRVFRLAPDDSDEDGVDDELDNCPSVANPDQTDTDSDGAGDACDDDDDGDWVLDVDDNCPLTPNEDQADTDGSGLGDACNDFIDEDNDEFEEEFDNCPVDFNPDQADFDGDGVGDVCDPDVDGDLVNNEYDSCPNTPSGAEVEGTGCSIDQLCPCDSARNHGQYQSCMVQAVNSFIEVGLLAKQDKGRILSESARSSCGK